MFFIITIILCLVFWLICYLGTGSDEKNIKSIASYPDAIQNLVKKDPVLGPKVKINKALTVFISNLITFTIVLTICGYLVRTDSWIRNFCYVFGMGMILNLFDYFIIDLMWWRHSSRIRFTSIQASPEMYLDPAKHKASFIRACPMFFLAALIASLFLMLTM